MIIGAVIFGLVVGVLVGFLVHFKMEYWSFTKVQDIIVSTIIGIICFLAITITSVVTIDGENNKWNNGKCTSISCNGEWEYTDSTNHVMRNTNGRTSSLTTYYYKCNECHKTERFLFFHN